MDEVMDTEDSSNQFSLNDFPDEILLKLMNHMNDTSLLNMTRTCHRFRAIAKEAFGNIYNGGKHGKYKMKILGENDIDEQKRYRPFFCTFGENIKAIEIASDDFEDFDRNHWVYNSMQKYCTSLTGLVIYYVSGVDLTKILLQQPCLTHLHLNQTYNLDTSWINHSFPNLKSFKWNVSFDEWIGSLNFDEFFDKNRQLIELSMSFYSEIEAINIIDSLNGKLKNLKMLELISEEVDSLPESTIIILNELELLTLECKNAYAILGAISKGCKNIKKLKITFPGVPGFANVKWNAAVATICSLKKLTKLKMTAENIGVLHLQRIIDSLPDLTRLHLTDVSYKSNAFENLPYIVASGTKLIELKVKVLPYDDIISLTSEFIKCMAELTQLNNSLKVMLSSDQDKFIFTRGEVRRGNSIIYFDNQDRNNDPSTLNLLNLNNSCLEKIVGLLDSKSQCELYKSCTKMQNIVKDYLSGHMFHATYKIDKNVFHSLGHHISRISMEQGCGDVYLILRRTINRYCSTITELILTVCGSIPDNPPVFVWPNLKTMIVKGSKISYQNLRSFMCPMLAHLEIRELEADVGALQAMDKFDHADAYRQLTTLMFGCYNEAVVKFLLGLDETICQQINVLSLNNLSVSEWEKSRKQKRTNSQLINILIRFRNLSTLKLLVPGVTDLNTQYLFENCTKLVNMEICQRMRWKLDVFEYLRANCKQIQFIRVIGKNWSTVDQSQLLEEVQELFPRIKIQIDSFIRSA